MNTVISKKEEKAIKFHKGTVYAIFTGAADENEVPYTEWEFRLVRSTNGISTEDVEVDLDMFKARFDINDFIPAPPADLINITEWERIQRKHQETQMTLMEAAIGSIKASVIDNVKKERVQWI